MQELLVALSTIVTGVATLALAVLTAVLASENRKLREAGTSPKVVAYLAPHPDGNGGVNFIVANVGRGPAISVTFSIEHDPGDFRDHNVMVGNHPDRAPLGVLPAGEKIVVLFGIGSTLFGTDDKSAGTILKPFKVSIKFSDLRGQESSTYQELDLRQFIELRGIVAKPPMVKVVDALTKIEGHLGNLQGTTHRALQLIDVTRLSDDYRRVEKGDG